MIDLDALKAARREAAGDAPRVKFGGREFVLPVELPFEVPESLAEVATATEAGDSAALTQGISRTLQALLGDDHDAFMKARPSMQDVQEFIGAVMKLYGFEEVGEASASESS